MIVNKYSKLLSYYALLAGVISILLISIIILSPTTSSNFNVPSSNIDPNKTYLIFGDFSSDDEVINAAMKYMADQYSQYFNATIIDYYPDVIVDLLIIIAHGNNNGTHIFSDLVGSSVVVFNSTNKIKGTPIQDIPAKKAIYMSCSIGRIRQIDLDTQHYAYSLKDEVDVYSGIINTTGDTLSIVSLDGWAVYFLDYVKSGMDWAKAEFLARQDVNNQL